MKTGAFTKHILVKRKVRATQSDVPVNGRQAVMFGPWNSDEWHPQG